MKVVSCTLSLLLLPLTGFASGTDDVLQYDDGTAQWFTYAGDYRGTWFSLDDFYPDVDASRFVINYAEIWFFHVYTNGADGWDTSDFIGEITDGTPHIPGAILFSEQGIAAHLTPTYLYPMSPCTTGTDFTVTEIPAFSMNGSPSIASDISPAGPLRSFTVPGPGVIDFWQNDFLIRVNGYVPSVDLSRTTWADLKSVFTENTSDR